MSFGASSNTGDRTKQAEYKVTSLKQLILLGGSHNSACIIKFIQYLLHMNKSVCRELKNIIGYNEDTPTLKTHYKRLKKQYQQLSAKARPIFLKKLRDMYNVN